MKYFSAQEIYLSILKALRRDDKKFDTLTALYVRVRAFFVCYVLCAAIILGAPSVFCCDCGAFTAFRAD